MEETVINFGGSVKALGEGRIEGYLVRFSSEKDPDASKYRDFFTAETDFDFDQWPGKSSVYYQHGLDGTLKKRRLGKATLELKDAGVWLETQLELRDDYERAIYAMAEAGKMGLSSGTAQHLVEREPVGDAHKIVRWPLGLDASLTPNPAEPRNVAVVSMKSFAAEVADLASPDDRAILVSDLRETLSALGYDTKHLRDIRQFEELLGDLGLASGAALKLAVGGFKALDPSDSGKAPFATELLADAERFRAQALRRQRNYGSWMGELRL
jgi:hypothetical protein